MHMWKECTYSLFQLQAFYSCGSVDQAAWSHALEASNGKHCEESDADRKSSGQKKELVMIVESKYKTHFYVSMAPYIYVVETYCFSAVHCHGRDLLLRLWPNINPTLGRCIIFAG